MLPQSEEDEQLVQKKIVIKLEIARPKFSNRKAGRQ
ncbi:MAG: hypothetical protein CLLPBCKN_007277 [Chroococcidiopsis cubana SAG 39.79]|nr:hypothetical protein [Chroococcidiopsis cubana SAG 39.79]